MALLVLLAGGCAASQAFVPAAYATGVSPDGENAASEYELAVEGQRLGHVRVWSGGAYRDATGERALTLIHVGFVLVNLGDTPWLLDEKHLYLEDVVLDDGTVYRLPPLRVDGSTRVAPSYKQEIDVFFSLPGEPSPGDVRSYRVAWAIDDGGTYAASTPFVAAYRQRRRAVYYYGYGWPYPGPYGWPYVPVWPPYGWAPYGWPYYPYPYDDGRYWKRPYPPWPLPPSYLRPHHR